MAFLTDLKEFQLRSKKVFQITVFSVFTICILVAIIDYLVDLSATTFSYILFCSISCLILFFTSLRWPYSKVVRIAFIFLCILILEGNVIQQPRAFNVIMYWFPIVPMAALILLGYRSFLFWTFIVFIIHSFNAFWVNTSLGQTYSVLITVTPYYLSGIIYLLAIQLASFLLYFLLSQAYSSVQEKNRELELLKTEIEHTNIRLEKYQKSIITISQNPSFLRLETVNFYKSITISLNENLQLSGSSIWLIAPNHQSFYCQSSYPTESEYAQNLDRIKVPFMFSKLLSGEVIISENTAISPDTERLRIHYSKYQNPYSIFCTPILVDRQVMGMIWCETNRKERKWLPEDVLFVQSLGELIALNFKNERIKNLMLDIRKQNRQLGEKNEHIQQMVHELNQLNEKLSSQNDLLEKTVEVRTQELRKQNEQLREYAFMNSHLLRAPLASILGICDLMEEDSTLQQDSELVAALIHSAKNLDKIVHDINDVIQTRSQLIE